MTPRASSAATAAAPSTSDRAAFRGFRRRTRRRPRRCSRRNATSRGRRARGTLAAAADTSSTYTQSRRQTQRRVVPPRRPRRPSRRRVIIARGEAGRPASAGAAAGAGAGDWRGSSRASRWNGRDPSFSARRTTERCSFSCERWTPRRGWRTSGSSTSSRSTLRRRRRRRSGADTSSDAARTYLASRRAGTPEDFCACWTACWWSREGRDRRWGAEGRAAGVRGGRWTWPGRTRAPECLRD